MESLLSLTPQPQFLSITSFFRAEESPSVPHVSTPPSMESIGEVEVADEALPSEENVLLHAPPPPPRERSRTLTLDPFDMFTPRERTQTLTLDPFTTGTDHVMNPDPLSDLDSPPTTTNEISPAACSSDELMPVQVPTDSVFSMGLSQSEGVDSHISSEDLEKLPVDTSTPIVRGGGGGGGLRHRGTADQ